MASAVQHGASTLPESVFNKFPEAEAVEIHLATGFQNMILDAPTLPQEIKDGIRDFCFENCQDERKPGQTNEQFVYTTRKKALGPFKRRMWEMDDAHKGPIIDELEAKFEFLMEKLGVFDEGDRVSLCPPDLVRDAGVRGSVSGADRGGGGGSQRGGVEHHQTV